MGNPLAQVEELNRYIREFQKIGSKMEAGQFFAAFRSLKRVESEFQKAKQEIIAYNKEKSE